MFNKIVIMLLIFLFIVSPFSSYAEKNDDYFSLIVLPDTQDYIAHYPSVFDMQIKWIINHKKEYNILHVIHLGDITNMNSEKQWMQSKKIIKQLDNNVDYSLALGNHDLNQLDPRKAAKFKKHFPPPDFKKKKSWGGSFKPDCMENSYQFFSFGATNYMVLTLEFGPRNEVLEWAREIIKKYPEHQIIVNTHNYLYYDDTRVSRSDHWNPHHYHWLERAGSVNDGEDMWEKLISKHQNIFLVLCGHIKGDGAGRLISIGSGGNYVYQLLSNYQSGIHGVDPDNGYLRILTFYPSKKIIIVKSYSPAMKKWYTNREHDFIIDMHLHSFKDTIKK